MQWLLMRQMAHALSPKSDRARACTEIPQERAACCAMTDQERLQPSPQLLGRLQAGQVRLFLPSLQEQPQQAPACLT